MIPIRTKKKGVFLENDIDFSFYEVGIHYLSTRTKWASLKTSKNTSPSNPEQLEYRWLSRLARVRCCANT